MKNILGSIFNPISFGLVAAGCGIISGLTIAATSAPLVAGVDLMPLLLPWAMILGKTIHNQLTSEDKVTFTGFSKDFIVNSAAFLGLQIGAGFLTMSALNGFENAMSEFSTYFQMMCGIDIGNNLDIPDAYNIVQPAMINAIPLIGLSPLAYLISRFAKNDTNDSSVPSLTPAP